MKEFAGLGKLAKEIEAKDLLDDQRRLKGEFVPMSRMDMVRTMLVEDQSQPARGGMDGNEAKVIVGRLKSLSESIATLDTFKERQSVVFNVLAMIARGY
jgi:hypothetical protein